MQFRHILIALIVAFVWGTNFIAARATMTEIPPFFLLALRFSLSTLPFIFFIPKPKNLSWPLLIGLGLTLGVGKMALVFLSIYLGLATGLASLLLQSHVLFTIIFSKIIYKAKISQRQALGMVISFLGMVLIAQELGGSANLGGFVCIIISAVFWAVSNILFQKAGKVDAFPLIIWIGLIPPLPLMGLSLLFDPMPQGYMDILSNVSMKGISGMAFIIIAATWIGTTCWAYLFKKYDASIVAPYALLIPVFGISSSFIVYDEHYTIITLMGCLSVFLGLLINQWPARKKAMTTPKP